MWTNKTIEDALKTPIVLAENKEYRHVCVDTRHVGPDDIFIATKGAVHDGHTFINDAIRNGAGLIILENPDYVPQYPHILVPNTLNALYTLARNRRKSLKCVVGITGTSGKTSTKEILARILVPYGKVYASPKSYNTHLGMSVTLASCPADADFCVLEMGMSMQGEISHLVTIATPDIAVITNVAEGHLANFSTVEGIAQAKAEIFEARPHWCIAHESTLKYEAVRNAMNNNTHTAIYGPTSQEYSYKNITYRNGAQTAQLIVHGTPYTLTLPMPGEHWIANSLAAITVLDCLRLPFDKPLTILAQISPSDRRGKTYSLSQNRLLVDESYNANPLSMRAALTAFAQYACTGTQHLVLGDMRELGPESDTLHADLFPVIKDLFPSAHIYTYGHHMHALHKKLHTTHTACHYTEIDTLTQSIDKAFGPNDALFIKASFGTGLGCLAQHIRNGS